MRSRSRGPSISSARPADQTAQVSTRPSRRRRARVSRRLAPRGLVRTPASFRRDISSCTSGAPSNSRGNCAPAAVDDANGSASSLRPKPCRPAPTPLQLGTGVLDPAPDGRVVRFQTALAEPLVAIAERERVPQVPAHSAQNQLGLGLSPREDRRSNGLLHHLFRLPAAAGRSCHTTDHRLMQRLSGTARDFFVVAAISTINVEVVLGEFVRCFHRPPGNSSPTRRSTVGGGGTRKPARDPIGYGREAMRWRMWSNWRQGSARSGGQSLKKYNRFDITDHHRSDMGPSKPRVAGSNPAGRAISRQILQIVRRNDHRCGHSFQFRPVTSGRRFAC